MNRNKKQPSKKTQPSKQQPSQKLEKKELEKKELTLEDLASVTGGFFEALQPDASVKLEDRAGNKGEAD